MTAELYPGGWDCFWIASDKGSNIAAFVTGGEGPIPKSVLSGGKLSIDGIWEAVHSLPVATFAKLFDILPSPNDFERIAEKGFFVYDWSDVERVASKRTHLYELLAAPTTPIKLNMLPPQLRDLADEVKFSEVVFSESLTLDVQDKFDCLTGE